MLKTLNKNNYGQIIGYAVDAWVPCELPRKEKMLGQYCVLEPLDINLEHGVIEVGSIIYSRALQKTRVATEVMYLMMKHVFDDLN